MDVVDHELANTGLVGAVPTKKKYELGCGIVCKQLLYAGRLRTLISIEKHKSQGISANWASALCANDLGGYEAHMIICI